MHDSFHLSLGYCHLLRQSCSIGFGQIHTVLHGSDLLSVCHGIDIALESIVICRLAGNQRLSRNVNLSDFHSRIHRAGSIIGLIGVLSTAQLNHAEQVVDIALILQFQIEVVKTIPDMGIREIIREDFSVSIHFLRREQPGILKLLLLASLASLFVAGTVVVGFPYLVRTVLGLSAEYYGAAESVMGVAAVMGSLFVGITAQKFRLRWLAFVFIGLGLSLIPTGIAFLLPVGPLGIYIILLVMFSLGQFGCSLFSTYAISVIQARTPEHLMGKIMSYVFTLSMCAQPAGQIFYGALFDWFSDSPYFVLIPSGILVCIIGLLLQ